MSNPDWADVKAKQIVFEYGKLTLSESLLLATYITAALRAERALLLSLGRGTCCSVGFNTRESVGLFRTSDMKDDRFHAGDCPVIAAWKESANAT